MVGLKVFGRENIQGEEISLKSDYGRIESSYIVKIF